MTPTATPAAMPTLANIRFNMILDHAKTNSTFRVAWCCQQPYHLQCQLYPLFVVVRLPWGSSQKLRIQFFYSYVENIMRAWCVLLKDQNVYNLRRSWLKDPATNLSYLAARIAPRDALQLRLRQYNERPSGPPIGHANTGCFGYFIVKKSSS